MCPTFPELQNGLGTWEPYKRAYHGLFPNLGTRLQKTISDEKNQIGLDSNGIQIFEYNFKDGIYDHSIKNLCFHSIFILSGNLTIKDQVLNKGDFVLIDSEKKIQLSVMNNCKIFEIISPLKPVYKTYAEVHNVN